MFNLIETILFPKPIFTNNRYSEIKSGYTTTVTTKEEKIPTNAGVSKAIAENYFSGGREGGFDPVLYDKIINIKLRQNV